MSVGDYKTVLSVLGSLNKTQLEDVRRRAAFLIQHKPGGSVAAVADEDWILHGILYELERRGLGDNVGFNVRRSRDFKGFQTKSETVRAILGSAAPDLSAVELRLLGEIAAKALASYVTWKDISRDIMLEHVHLIPLAISRSFPDYLECGMLNLLVKKT